MRPKAVLLDFDGTLIDSTFQVYLGTANVFKESGVPVPSFEMFCEIYEAPYDTFYKKHGITASDEQVVAWYFAKAKTETQPFFQDVHEVISRLSARGYLLGIISAHYVDKVVERCKNAKLLQYMQVIVGRAHSKVAPIHSFCARYNVPLENTYYIGDFASDVRDANEAGVVSVGITRGNDTEEMLFRNGAKHCIPDLHTLLEII
jgi:phosphoglycolate phosphatase-like HAD superfamily hydrolase